MKKWTAVQYDLTKILSAEAKSGRIKIPTGQKLELIIQLDDEAYDKLSKDPTWVQKMQEKANSKVLPALDTVKKKVKLIDEKSQKFDAKTAEIFQKDINSFISQSMEKAGKEMATEVDKLFEDFKKGKKELTKFRIKSGGKITLNAIGIIAAAAVAGATHAALAPPAIVAIVRSAVVISQECVKLALDADKFAEIINAELKVLQKLMSDGKAKAGKEVALGALSGLLGIETPSVANLESHIGVHKVDISKLAIESHKLGPKIYEAMDRQEKWAKKLAENEKTLPPAKVTKLKTKLKTAEKALQAIIDTTEKINKAVERAEGRQQLYDLLLKELQKGVPGWTKYVAPIVGAAVDIGLSVASGGKALDVALGVIQTAETDITSTLIDNA